MAYRVEEVGWNPHYALFTPAVSMMYSRHCSRKTVRNMFPGLKELDWYRPDNTYFRHPAALYSAGHAYLDLEKSHEQEAMISQRDRSGTVLVADSGGYQIGKGVIKFGSDLRSKEADEMRMKLMTWLETHADYSMIIDFPAWAIGTPNFLFKDGEFDKCLEETAYNCEFILKHRTPGKIKWLNVIQGRTPDEADTWYERVKDFPFEGWAFAGPVAGDPEITLRMIIRLRDDKMINENKRWIHMLGKSRLSAVFVTNVIHQAVREHVFNDSQISYDSASAFLYAANGSLLVNYRINTKGMVFQTANIPNSKSLTTLTTEFPWINNLTEKMRMDEFCIDTGGKNYLDSHSYAIVMHHNTVIQMRAINEINRLCNFPSRQLVDLVPQSYVNFKSIVHEVFKSETPYDTIKKYSKDLKNLLNEERDGVSSFSSLFEMEDTAQIDEKTLREAGCDTTVDEYISDMEQENNSGVVTKAHDLFDFHEEDTSAKYFDDNHHEDDKDTLSKKQSQKKKEPKTVKPAKKAKK